MLRVIRWELRLEPPDLLERARDAVGVHVLQEVVEGYQAVTFTSKTMKILLYSMHIIYV